MATVNIDGHEVDENKVDLFFDGLTGERVTDEERDESRRRIEEAEALEGDDAITWDVIES